MAHIALYRTWRSQSFREVVGQQHIVQTLQNSLKEGRLSHAYLFSGPRGTGKTSAAKILAKAVNCEKGPSIEPCNECETCKRITEGSVIDVVEIDAASNRGVDEIRDLRDKVKYAPTEVRQKVYIIDEVHMLTTEAFNALLKTLEEPPSHVMFILATTEPHRLPATVISRCQRFEFRRIPLEEQVAHLEHVCAEESIEAETAALQFIARLSEGGMRDALSLLDQISSFSSGRITYADAVSLTGGIASEQFEKLAGAVRDRDTGTALEIIDSLMQEGKSAEKCMESLIHYFRDLLMIRMIPDSPAVTGRIVDAARFGEISNGFRSEDIFRIIDVLNHYQTEMKYSNQPQTLFEVAMMKACSSGSSGESHSTLEHSLAEASSTGDSVHSGELQQLKQRITQLEQQLAKVLQSGAAVGRQDTPVRGTAASGSTVKSGGGTSTLKKSSVKLDGFLKAGPSDLFKQVQMKWSQVLDGVKEKKISVRAWLIDGEPVAFAQDTVLLGFKNTMHRDMTNRPDHKEIIEQVMAGIFDHPIQFVTVLMNEWKEAQAGAAEASPEIMELEPVDPPGTEKEWIREAIQLFGEDLVTIKED